MERRGERCVARVRVVGRSREVPDEGVEGEDGGRAAGRAGRDVRGERGDATRDDDAERGRVGGPGDAPRDVRERGARDWTGLFGDARVRRVGGRDGDGGCVKGVAENAVEREDARKTRGSAGDLVKKLLEDGCERGSSAYDACARASGWAATRARDARETRDARGGVRGGEWDERRAVLSIRRRGGVRGGAFEGDERRGSGKDVSIERSRGVAGGRARLRRVREDAGIRLHGDVSV